MPRAVARRTHQRHEPIRATLTEYRRLRDELRETKGRRKQQELCAALDELWREFRPAVRRTLTAEFMAYEKSK